MNNDFNNFNNLRIGNRVSSLGAVVDILDLDHRTVELPDHVRLAACLEFSLGQQSVLTQDKASRSAQLAPVLARLVDRGSQHIVATAGDRAAKHKVVLDHTSGREKVVAAERGVDLVLPVNVRCVQLVDQCWGQVARAREVDPEGDVLLAAIQMDGAPTLGVVGGDQVHGGLDQIFAGEGLIGCVDVEHGAN